MSAPLDESVVAGAVFAAVLPGWIARIGQTHCGIVISTKTATELAAIEAAAAARQVVAFATKHETWIHTGGSTEQTWWNISRHS